jgi:hypothetical protein
VSLDWKEAGAWLTGAVGLIVGIWNRFGIKAISVKVDGFLVQYVKGKEAAAFRKGQDNERENPRPPNRK